MRFYIPASLWWCVDPPDPCWVTRQRDVEFYCIGCQQLLIFTFFAFVLNTALSWKNFPLVSSSGSSEEPVTSQDDVDLSSAFPGLSAQFQWILMPRYSLWKRSRYACTISYDRRFSLSFRDQLYNQNQRTEFFYEQSPSTHLCLAIVDLISDTRVGAGFILHCVHEVSQQLVPDSQGKVNEEIDHYFTIGWDAAVLNM